MKKLLTIIICCALILSLMSNANAVNEEFTTADALKVLKCVAGMIELNDEEYWRYDLDNDGLITTTDALIMLRIIAGIEAPHAPVYAPENEPVIIKPIQVNEDTFIIRIDDYIAEVVRLVNIERTSHGLTLFSRDNAALNEAAKIRATELTKLFSHTRPDGSNCFTILGEVGVNYMTAGENLAEGQKSPQEVVEAWMNSPGHRANILHAGFTQIGIGVAVSEGGRLIWVQLFIG